MIFRTGDRVRCRPDRSLRIDRASIEADGCVPGTVIGYVPRGGVKVRLTVVEDGLKQQRDRVVDASRLIRVQ